MSNSREEETYSTIFTSLKHPIRRKILRMLHEHSKSFSEMQETFRIESSHLTYHLENLRELIYKRDDGRYRLSTFGEAAITTMRKVEEAPKNSSLSIKWKSVFAVLMIGLVILTAVGYTQYLSFNKISAEIDVLTSAHQKSLEELDAITVKHWESILGPGYFVITRAIYIRADGSIDPPTAPLSTDDNVTYTLTKNIYSSETDSIVVQRDNIVVDGADYTIQGTGWLSRTTGIGLSHRSNVKLKNVQVTNFSYGIHLSYSSNNTIAGNNALNNKDGIGLSTSSNNNVLTGNIASNNGYGISLDSSSNNNVLTGNIASNNEQYGIFIAISSDNTLSGNTVSNNSAAGIGLYYCSNNTLFHNNFINNTNQLRFSHNSFNTYDDGYPSGGNYWSDYEERYPNASEIDGSGIWDTPYIMDLYNRDNYPRAHR